MAGNCKPSNNILIGSKIEMTDYKIGSYNGPNSCSPYGLFNGRCENEWNTANIFYWSSAEMYFDITLKQPVNIYRSGTESWDYSCKPIAILKRNNKTSVFEDITSKIKQNCSPIANGQWELYIKNLPAGEYKFQGTTVGYRTDSEWFLETADSMLLKSNNQYYSIKDEYYNTEAKTYMPVEELNFYTQSYSLSNLFNYITINDETFRPIDKFDNFQIVQQKNIPIKVSGCKSKSELIVANNNIDINIADKIRSFTLATNQTNSTIKVAISIDNGLTWNTYLNNSLFPLNITIPLKEYSAMDEAEKNDFTISKDKILSSGIDIKIFNELDFSSLLSGYKTLRFAYVIELQEGESAAEIDKLSWNFDARGKMYKMKDNEITVDIYEHSVLVTPQINTSLIKTNIVF